MSLTDDEEKVLKGFAKSGVNDLNNEQLRENSKLDEFTFAEVLNALEKRGFIERYVGHTTLLTKGRIYVRDRDDEESKTPG